MFGTRPWTRTPQYHAPNPRKSQEKDATVHVNHLLLHFNHNHFDSAVHRCQLMSSLCYFYANQHVVNVTVRSTKRVTSFKVSYPRKKKGKEFLRKVEKPPSPAAPVASV